MSSIFVCGSILSILQSILFWEKELGISVILFVISFLVGLIYLMYKYNLKQEQIKQKKKFIIYKGNVYETMSDLVKSYS